MNTKINIMNDAFLSLDENMNAIDVAARYLIALASLGAILTVPSVLYMNILILTALYAFTTAITCWDPVYALLGFSNDGDDTSADTLNEGAVTSGVGSSGHYAANDSQHIEQRFRKAS